MVRGIFCDLEEAFDSVNHHILLSKLEYYGITGIENVSYKTYLHDRYKRASIYNKKINNFSLSNWAQVK
jgi:hypothetical protein